MHRLIIKQTAIDMAHEAYEWYEDKQVGLGVRFLDELDASYDKIHHRHYYMQRLNMTFGKAF